MCWLLLQSRLLAGLTNLYVLHLGDNKISDISPLAGLTNPAIIDLESNHISDITPLAALTKLERLGLRNTTSSIGRL